MMAQYTLYFKNYLHDRNLPDVLDSMPEDDSGMTFKERLIARNIFKEIGAETEDLFEMYMDRRAQEAVTRFKWKIETYMAKRDAMFDRYASLSDVTEFTESGSQQHKTEAEHTGNFSTDENVTRGEHISGEDGATRHSETDSNSDTNDTGTDTHETESSERKYYNPIGENTGSESDGSIYDRIDKTGKDTETKALENVNTGHSETDSEDAATTKRDTDGTEDTHQEEEHKENATDFGESSYNTSRKTSRTYDVLYRLSQSNAELMKAMNDLDVLYEQALAYFDTLFMGVI